MLTERMHLMKKNLKIQLSDVLLIASAALLLVGIIVLGSWFADSRKAESEINEIEWIYIDTDTEKPKPDSDKSPYKSIENCVAWVEIPDTKISYPIMQKKGNPEYYLHRNYKGDYSYSGTPFLDERCNISQSSNNIVYGHNMKDGTIFSRLLNFKNQDYCKAHSKINLVIEGEKTEYTLYAVARVKSDDIWYSYTDNTDENTFNNLISHIQCKSLYLSDKEIKYGDFFITLSTCEYSQENGRLILIGTRSESDV